MNFRVRTANLQPRASLRHIEPSGNPQANHRKTCLVSVLVVGDTACGKTSLIRKFNCEQVQVANQGRPGIWDEYRTTLHRPYAVFRAFFIDVPSTSNVRDRIFYYSIRNVDVVAICFAMDDYESFCSVSRVWLPEVCTHLPHCPVVIVGLKSDVRLRKGHEDFLRGGESLLPPSVADNWASQLNIKFGLECSALDGTGVHDVLLRILATFSLVQRPKSST